MPRFYVPNIVVKDGILRVEGAEAKHIQKVLRLKKGDWVTVFNGSEMDYEGVIIQETTSSILINIKNVSSSIQEPPIEITIAQSLLKGEKMDYLIQKAVELGVKKIIPFFSSRSIPKYDRLKSLSRHKRWEKIAIEASKQCGRGIIPEICLSKSYSEVLNLSSSDSLNLILWEKEGLRLKEILKNKKEKVLFIVGPEGGFNLDEIKQAEKLGFITVNLGKRIMRSETASLTLISIIQYEWGDIG